MKIFAIRDETDQAGKDLAWLLYYEKEKRFYIELPDAADEWDTPLLLASFLKKGERTVNSYWSELWVQQRVIPSDRQNIGQVLRDNGLERYDLFELLMLSKGRCAQDDYYLAPLDEAALPGELHRRFQTKLEDVVPLEDFGLLTFFRDGTARKCGLERYLEEHRAFSVLLKKPELFASVQLQPGGYGVTWDAQLNISDTALYRMGRTVPLSAADFRSFVTHRVVNAAEAAELLDCSRQNISDLTRKGKLRPIKATEKNTLYLKSEILRRKWK